MKIKPPPIQREFCEVVFVAERVGLRNSFVEDLPPPFRS